MVLREAKESAHKLLRKASPIEEQQSKGLGTGARLSCWGDGKTSQAAAAK